ncbi:serine/threonine protein kinase [Sulfolobus sp. A20]|uniref:serine protein kinase RIO n=1 Tax=Sulfolobus sp. B1 TaxID=2200888 RepID=UPI000845DEC6|nr:MULTISPECIES: serine protein kinase RIO [unclassified Sulfolobus]TRM74695.1 serine protein kinase RIO [Sulfolobus sp. E5]TRM78446.1 serine protein kinase RIO [Sulfolobus sp. A20-N-F8]TRM80862.1 serine protein kinase RIO [Sulfolobus sp. D5]TRM82699.1 serine protein kinase RIO [Sulfolobus sp. A20-N-F6]TRM87920.1 serine protein kinase RIO [Sulfolobus sp. E3]TRM89201.1 serine protein kinase RIO [Sulfolobus sp. C3]TRM92522.1 serine protein kinase RIO [Sulfolobus sp. A20-N-G8]TRN02075.1 serine
MVGIDKKTKEEKKLKDEDLFKVVDSTIDSRTYFNLIQIARRLNIEAYFGAISSGKEARIYPAKTIEGKYYAIKIYYTSTAQSKRAIKKYTEGDIRFKDVKISNTKQLINTWARKEYKNLSKMYQAGVRVPRPIMVYENILVMEFIGENGLRAPLLKELGDEEITEGLYEDLISQIHIMVKRALLVHGDLSEYNVMVFNEKCYIIDVSQAISIDHDEALKLLERDIENINNFFESKGINIKPKEEIILSLISGE